MTTKEKFWVAQDGRCFDEYGHAKYYTDAMHWPEPVEEEVELVDDDEFDE